MSYYDFKVSEISVGEQGRPELCGHQDDQQKLLRVPVYVEQHDLEWWEKRWKETVGDTSYGDLCKMKITDNGEHGDGIQVSIYAGEERYEVASFLIPDSSVQTIIAALQAVARLRKWEQRRD